MNEREMGDNITNMSKAKQRTLFSTNCARKRHTQHRDRHIPTQSKEKLGKTKCQPHFKKKKKMPKKRSFSFGFFSIYFWCSLSVHRHGIFFILNYSTFHWEMGPTSLFYAQPAGNLNFEFELINFLYILIFFFFFLFIVFLIYLFFCYFFLFSVSQ